MIVVIVLLSLILPAANAVQPVPPQKSFLGISELNVPYPPGLPIQWALLANGFPGILCFTTGGGGYDAPVIVSATIQFDDAPLPHGVSNPIENLEDLQFFSHHNGWYVRFYRPGPAQTYWGLIDKNLQNINGEFTQQGFELFFAFDATVAPTVTVIPPPPPSIASLATYSILANGYAGQLNLNTDLHQNSKKSFSGLGKNTIEYYDGQLQHNSGKVGSDDITQIIYIWRYHNWYMKFYRAGALQTYYAMWDYTRRNFHGQFNQGDSYISYPFDGTVIYDASFGPSDVVLGRYTALGNSWATAYEIKTLTSGRFSTDSEPSLNPLATADPPEKLLNLTVSAQLGGMYLSFYRPGPAQWWFGLFERDFFNIHGSFNSGGNTYHADATPATYTSNELF